MPTILPPLSQPEPRDWSMALSVISSGWLRPIIDMEIKVSKKRTNKRGITFENKIDLSNWLFNQLDYKNEKAFDDFEENVQKAIEKEKEKLMNRLEPIDKRIRKIASEALQISFEKEISVYFWELYEKPEMLRIDFSDLAEDGYYVSVDLKKAIKDCLLENCGRDGYVHQSEENVITKFADMLKELETEVRTAIRPKETK